MSPTLPVAKVASCLSLLGNYFTISQPLQTGANNLQDPHCSWKVCLPSITCLSCHLENAIRMISNSEIGWFLYHLNTGERGIFSVSYPC